VEAPKQIILY